MRKCSGATDRDYRASIDRAIFEVEIKHIKTPDRIDLTVHLFDPDLVRLLPR
jgi:hypothetical protein